MIYVLGIFGAFAYFWQQADSFWDYFGRSFRLLSGLPSWSMRSFPLSRPDRRAAQARNDQCPPITGNMGADISG